MSLIHDFIGLFFPRICQSCGSLLYKNEATLCTPCIANLPKTNFHLIPDNPVMETFWGRVKIEAATSFLYYSKSGKVQHMIHRFKYKGKREIGALLGKMLAADLALSPCFKQIDLVIPVPLHWTKLKKRGFNQSEIIGRAMAEVLRTDFTNEVLVRKIATDTQTKKSRLKRAENVEGKFGIQHPERIKNKHVLLVDDIITTGATIEACTIELQKTEGVKVSLASLGFASK